MDISAGSVALVRQCVAAAHAISDAGVFTANPIHALAGGALRASVAGIAVVFFIGALIAVAPRVVFAVAMAIGAAASKAGGVFTAIKGAIIGSRGRTSSGATQGVGLEVTSDADGWATSRIVGIGLAGTGAVTNTIKPAGASSLIGAVIVRI